MCFFVVDTQFILDGRYNQMDKDDYIFAAMKIYADYCLIFGLMLKACA